MSSEDTEDEEGWGEEGMSWFVWSILMHEAIAIIEESTELMTADVYWEQLAQN